MTYYLLLDGDSERDTLYDTNVLGEESFGTFYVSMGFSLLQKILNERKIKDKKFLTFIILFRKLIP